MAEVTPVVRLECITKSYGTGTGAPVEVLHGITARLDPGEFVALIGPSGSGKSTLLNIIGLLDRPTSGRLMIDGEATAALSDAAITHLRSRSIGFVFQQPCLLSAFTALENVMMPMLVDRHFPDEAMRTRAAQLLDEMGLAKQAGNPSNNLSGGQQQRVSIARALAMNPSLILADEPTGNLDSKSAESVLTLMRKVNAENGTSFLIVTHNEALAARCDRVLELVDGALTSTPQPAASPATSRSPAPLPAVLPRL